MKLVIYPEVDGERLEKIRAVDPDLTVSNANSETVALQEIEDADCFFGKITPALLSKAGLLRWVQSPTASLEHYIFPELVEHPAILTNMRGLFSDIIADQVMGYVLCFARQLHVYLRQQQSGTWAPVGGEASRSDFRSGPGVVSAIDLRHQQLRGKTMGIIGLGEIGRELAQRANQFGMQVVAIDPHVDQSHPAVSRISSPDNLDELLGCSDYVVVAAPQTPATVGLLGRRQFQAMRPQSYVINVGRGALIKLDDLVASLQAEEIAGAALDVFEIEPLPSEHPLWRFSNVILTPHIAGYAPCIAERHLGVLLDNLRRFLSGKPLRNQVSKQLWY